MRIDSVCKSFCQGDDVTTQVDQGCKVLTVFPQISAWALISYRASKTRRLNETGRLFESRRLFLVAHFQGTVDLRRSLIAAHLRGRWALPTGDLQPRQGWPSFALRKHFLRSGRVVFLRLTLQKTIARRTSTRFAGQIDRLTNGRSLNTNFAVKLRVCAVREAHPLKTLAFI